jgi:sterol desaturase/sphingolipid hydroxylase (fatty acid hydroxylase superfamily)
VSTERILQVAIVAGVALTLFVLERFRPLRRPERPLVPRLLVNGAMSVLTYGTAFALVQPVAMRTLQWTSEQSFGVLALVGGVPWATWLLGFLLLDLSFYHWHRLNHAVPFLWRFHNVHHVDPDLDVSTAFRFHFGEVALSAGFRSVQIAAIGVPLAVYAAYEVVFQAATYFHHSNVRLPERLERALNCVFVTPRMHGIHHSDYREETDSNYSVVFSVWDRLHRSFRWGIPQHQIRIGVPGYARPSDNSVGNLVWMAFGRQRDYWQGRERRPGGRGPGDPGA